MSACWTSVRTERRASMSPGHSDVYVHRDGTGLRVKTVSYKCNKNGATCINEPGSFLCICPRGWYGHTCENGKLQCNVIWCKDKASYINKPGSLLCICLPGWYGPTCENGKLQCNVIWCKNGATCINEPRSFRCICPPGWYGPTCENSKIYVICCHLCILFACTFFSSLW